VKSLYREEACPTPFGLGEVNEDRQMVRRTSSSQLVKSVKAGQAVAIALQRHCWVKLHRRGEGAKEEICPDLFIALKYSKC
jgi:hypothetical protein